MTASAQTNITVPMLNMRGGFVPSTIDEAKRTVEVVWTTGERGLRNGFWQDFYEELAIQPENVRLHRLIGGPVLDQHRHESVRNTLGVVDSCRPVMGANSLVEAWQAVVRFSKRADDIFQEVMDGIIRHVSVGYFVDVYEELPESFNNLPVLRATDWSPAEISFVTVPFDSKASVRSSESFSNCTIISFNRSKEMPKPIESNGNPPSQTPEPPVPPAEPTPPAPTPAPEPEPEPTHRSVPPPSTGIDPKALAKAHAALQSVRQAGQVAGFNAEEMAKYEDMLASGKDVNAIRAQIIGEAAKRQKAIDTSSSRVTVGTDLHRESVERGISEILLARANPGVYRSQITDAGRRFSRDNVLRLAERLLEANGINIDGLDKYRVLSQACKFRSGSHSTSDFYWLFESSVERILKDEFNKVRLNYLPLSRNVELPDFRPSNYVTVGDNFNLVKQGENEELTYGTFDHDSRSFRLYKFARGIRWSLEMMINDDTSVLERLPSMVNRAGDKLKARLAWSMIVGDANAGIGPNGITMSDGNPLFGTVHGNIAAAGSKIDKASVAAARRAIRKQRAFGDKEAEDTLDLEPKYLVCGPEIEQDAIDFLAANFVAVNQETAAAHNLARSLTLIVENRITDNSWYVVAPPPEIDGIITATLQGNEGMFLDTDEDFETDGFKMKGRMMFGVHMARWEGWYKNPGA